MKSSKKLKFKQILEVIPTSPFHFDSTFYKPAHFPTKDTQWEPGKRWQTMRWQGECLGLIFENVGSVQKPKILLHTYSDKKLTPEFLQDIKNETIWRYNLNMGLANFYNEVGNDKFLAPIIKKFRGMRPMHHGSLYEYLIIAIVLQNATVRRSVSMMQSLFEKYGTLLEYDNTKLWCFWEPKTLAQAEEQELRALKVGYRAKSIVRVSPPFATGEIDELTLRKKAKEEQEQTLLSLYGIGPQSVGYIMMDVFHHWDFLKHISPWEQKILSRVFFNKNLVPVEKMVKYFNKWGKWKALAVNYAWENIWWKRRNEHIPWLEKEIRI